VGAVEVQFKFHHSGSGSNNRRVPFTNPQQIDTHPSTQPSTQPRFHPHREDITLTLGSMSGAYLTGLSKYKFLYRSARALSWLLYSDVRLATLRMWESQTDRRQLR